MLMYTREGTAIESQQEKVKNETRQQMNNNIYFKGFSRFGPFCCLESIITYLRWAVFIFALGKPSWAKPTFKQFLKVRHFPGEIDNKPLPGVLKLLSRYNRLSKQSFVRFLYDEGPLATSSPAWPLRGQKSLPRSLRNSLNSIPRWFQWFFRSFVIF